VAGAPLAEWQETRDTLQLWTQIVGKVRMASTPLMSHWWNVTFFVTARGLTSPLMPHEDRAFQIDFDFIDQQLVITGGGWRVNVDAARRPIRRRLLRRVHRTARPPRADHSDLDDAGRDPRRHPFDQDTTHTTYDGEQARQFWLALVQMSRVFEVFRSRFIGKVSPVHLFWGGLDLAVTRFSGRPAPPHPGGAPNCGPHVMHEAYSHEVSSAGYWPGPDGEGIFYSYAYPIPDRFADADFDVPAARYDQALGEFVLPYEAVRTAAGPGPTPAGVPPSHLRRGSRSRSTGTAPRSSARTDPAAKTDR
jgi:hypothetical protein